MGNVKTRHRDVEGGKIRSFCRLLGGLHSGLDFSDKFNPPSSTLYLEDMSTSAADGTFRLQRDIENSYKAPPLVE
jgi:hypothetical protein